MTGIYSLKPWRQCFKLRFGYVRDIVIKTFQYILNDGRFNKVDKNRINSSTQ